MSRVRQCPDVLDTRHSNDVDYTDGGWGIGRAESATESGDSRPPLAGGLRDAYRISPFKFSNATRDFAP